MNEPCEQARQRLRSESLEAGVPWVSEDPHLAACPACRAWAVSQERIVGGLSTLERLVAPAELDQRVLLAADDASRRERVLAALGELERLEAPPELDEAVFRADRDEPFAAFALRNLEPRSAPAVLDRLVEEELADLAGARANRFVGSLERKSAPASVRGTLEEQWRHDAAPRRRFTLVRPAVAGLAAAAVLLALPFLTRGGAEQPTERTYSFRVVHAGTSTEGLDGMARAWVDGLTGGALSTEEGR